MIGIFTVSRFVSARSMFSGPFYDQQQDPHSLSDRSWFNGFSQSLQRAASCPHHAVVDVGMSHGAGGFRLATRNRFWAENLGLGAGRSTSVEARVDDIARKGIRAF
jgi:hypothetical protein